MKSYTIESGTIDVSSPPMGADDEHLMAEQNSPYYCKDFKQHRDSIALDEILSSKKPNPEAFFDMMLSRSRGQRLLITAAYERSYETSLFDQVSKVYKKKACVNAARLLAQNYNAAYLELIHEAIRGKKQLELVFLVFLRQAEDYDELIALYQKTFNKTLVEDVAKALSGDMRVLCNNYILEKDSDSASMYDDPAEEAEKLTHNIKSKGLEELITLTSRCTRDFLSQVLVNFHNLTEKHLLDLYKASSKNVVFDALQLICDLCRGEAIGIASYIHAYGDKDPGFILNLMLVRSEVDLKQILVEYETLTGGKSLPNRFQKAFRDEESMVFTKLVAPYLLCDEE